MKRRNFLRAVAAAVLGGPAAAASVRPPVPGSIDLSKPGKWANYTAQYSKPVSKEHLIREMRRCYRWETRLSSKPYGIEYWITKKGGDS